MLFKPNIHTTEAPCESVGIQQVRIATIINGQWQHGRRPEMYLLESEAITDNLSRDIQLTIQTNPPGDGERMGMQRRKQRPAIVSAQLGSPPYNIYVMEW
jgi:hypothetical protein